MQARKYKAIFYGSVLIVMGRKCYWRFTVYLLQQRCRPAFVLLHEYLIRYGAFCAIRYHLCGLGAGGGGWGLTFGKVAGFLHGCFSRFLNCTNDTKSCKASQSVNLTSIFTASRAFLQGCLIIIDYDELLVAIVWLSWTIARNPNHLKLWHVVGEVRT